jgi:hypothetical protein
MKQKHKLGLLVFVIISSFCLFGAPYKNSLAEEKQFSFEKNICYDIYYQVENHVQYITNVKIIDTVTIAGAAFLEIQSLSVLTKDVGYISITNIIAILPTGSPKPQIYK